MSDELSSSEREQRRKRRKRKKALPFGSASRITVVVVLFVLLCAAVFISFKWDLLSPDSLSQQANFFDSSKEEAFADITGMAVLENNINCIDTGLIYISDTSIVQLNHDCEKVYSEKHSYTDPLLRSANTYSIAFNEGGSEYRIIHDKHIVHEGVQGSSITDCDINDSGTYCILSDQTGYLSRLNVYDKNNKFVYSYSFSDYYAVSVSINPSGNRVVVGAFNSYDGRLVSKVYILDVTKSEPVSVYTYDDKLIYTVRFLSDDRFAVITDTQASVIKSDGSKETPYAYSSRLLTAYDIGKNGIVLSLSTSDDGRSCSLVTIDTDGHEVASFQTDQKIISVYAAPDRTAVISYGQLCLYNSYGTLFGKWEIGSDAKSVLLPQNKTAYILGVSGITKMSLKY